MKVLIASIVTGLIVTPIVTIGTCYYFKDDILKFYDETLSDFFGDSIRTRRTLGRAARVMPLSNYPVTPKKEIELIELEPKKYIVIENPYSNITLGIEIE
jgi:hypothetical protein